MKSEYFCALACTDADDYFGRMRLLGACDAMARFMAFVWMEAWAQAESKETGQSVATERALYLVDGLTYRGLFRLEFAR